MTVDAPVGLFIDGVRLDSVTPAAIPVIDPSFATEAYRLPDSSNEEIDRAVQSARRVFEKGSWAKAPPSERRRVLHKLGDLLSAEASELDRLDARDMGKPVGLRRSNAASAAAVLHFYAEAIDKTGGEVFASDAESLVLRQGVPVGVVGAITPWNFPTMNAVRKLAPALAAGNCVVLKPSELASRSAMRIALLALEAGLPPGVLNLVPGSGAKAGEALALHQDVDMLTFTGSTAVGKRLMQYAGRSNLKPVMLECGGKSPHVVFDDSGDIEAMATAIADGILTNQGQVCSAGTRLIVARSIEAELCGRIAARMRDVVIGDAGDPRTSFGPLSSARQFERVRTLVSEASQQGAKLVTGGQPLSSRHGGYFFEPTLFRQVSADADIARQEIFGPVLSVMAFDGEDEAVHLARSTIYGLMAYVWSTDLSRSLRVAKAIRSSVFVNARAPAGEGAGHAAAFEPMRQSGFGAEGGLAGLQSYQRRQTIWINH
nr:aldehyde dehydrogenase family protein [Sphingomonas sp. Y57]